MAKATPEKVVHKVEPRGEETTEEVAEGSVLKSSPDAPPEAHPANILEMDPNDYIRERTVGPTDPVGPFDELGEEPGDEESGEETSTGDEDEKEASSKSEEQPEEQPAGTDELSERLANAEKDSQMLKWILDNPKRFAASVREEAQGPPTAEEPVKPFRLEEPEIPTGEDLEKLSDKELFDLSVRQETVRQLNGILPKFFQDLEGLKTFQGSVEDLLMKSATGVAKEPLFPRWEELQPTIKQVMQKHPTLDRREAYWQAERMVPAKSEPAAAPKVPLKETTGIPEQGPTAAKPKPASPEAIRASRLVNLGRSAGAYASNSKPATPKEAVEMAMRDHGFPGEEP